MAARKNYTAAQIINGLRRAEVGLANGKSMKEVIRDLGVSEQTYYRWRREYGGMKTSQAKRLNIGCGTALGGRSKATDADLKTLGLQMSFGLF